MLPKRVFIGEQYGRWRIFDDAPGMKRTQWYIEPRVWAKCSCGTQRIVSLRDLLRGKSLSCGCVAREKLGNWNKTRGMRCRSLSSSRKLESVMVGS
jgi:hypothetical protein